MEEEVKELRCRLGDLEGSYKNLEQVNSNLLVIS